MIARLRRWWLAAGVALGAFVPGGVALAQTPAPVMPTVPARVVVGVTVIRASGGEPSMDARLQAIASALRRTPFTRFQWVRDGTVRLADGRSEAIDLGGGRRLVLTMSRHDAKAAHIEARYERPGAAPAATELTVHRDRAFFFSLKGDRPGEAVLLQLSVRY